MEKTIDFLTKWSKTDSKEFCIDFDLFWEQKKITAWSFFHRYEFALIEAGFIKKRIDVNYPLESLKSLTNDNFLCKCYQEILSENLINPHPLKFYHRYYATLFFFEELVHELTFVTEKLMLKMDAFLLKCVAGVSASIFESEGIKERTKWHKEQLLGGKKRAFNTDERRKATIKIGKRILSERNIPSINNLKDKIIEEMTINHEKKKGPKPYADTQTTKILNNAGFHYLESEKKIVFTH